MIRASSFARRAWWGAAGAFAARLGSKALRQSAVGPSLERVNHRGATVSIAAGPSFAVAASTTAAAGAGTPALASAAFVAGLGAGAVGLYDDLVGQRPEEQAVKGFHGHLSALREGRVTSGLVKVAGVGASALIAAGLIGRARRGSRPVTDLVIDAGLIAGAANLVNLLDLRPGRAVKVGLAVGVPLASGPRSPGARSGSGGSLLAGPAGAAAALLDGDLNEQTMLGDTGANAWGALLGVAAAHSRGRPARLAMLAGIVGLTLASEKVSFTEVIESTPVLRDIDAWGRRSR